MVTNVDPLEGWSHENSGFKCLTQTHYIYINACAIAENKVKIGENVSKHTQEQSKTTNITEKNTFIQINTN